MDTVPTFDLAFPSFEHSLHYSLSYTYMYVFKYIYIMYKYLNLKKIYLTLDIFSSSLSKKNIHKINIPLSVQALATLFPFICIHIYIFKYI